MWKNQQTDTFQNLQRNILAGLLKKLDTGDCLFSHKGNRLNFIKSLANSVFMPRSVQSTGQKDAKITQ